MGVCGVVGQGGGEVDDGGDDDDGGDNDDNADDGDDFDGDDGDDNDCYTLQVPYWTPNMPRSLAESRGTYILVGARVPSLLY